MSILPYAVNEILLECCEPLTDFFGQNFGLGLLNNDLRYRRPRTSTVILPPLAGSLRPYHYFHPDGNGVSTISNRKDQFIVSMYVQHFKPEEINVKVVNDCLVVEAEHEENQDKHGFVSRQFTRRYKLPEGVNAEAFQSSLSSDGVLSIAAPKKIKQNVGREIQIPIIQTDQPAIK